MKLHKLGITIKKEEKEAKNHTNKDIDTKLSLLMKSLTEFYEKKINIYELKVIIDQSSIISLRILDWFITNYSKKNKVLINTNNNTIDVYQNYKLQLKSYGKAVFDPFNRKNKLIFYYTDTDFIETSCGQLCFFRWCIQNNILQYVKEHFAQIEQDMKTSLKNKKKSIEKDLKNKRKPTSISAASKLTKTHNRILVTFD